MNVRVFWQLVRPWRRQLIVALAAAVGAAVCAVALTTTAAWLIATAAGRVPVLTLMVAIVAVRACGIGRGVLRYVERLAGHDAVLRMFGTIRERAVTGLAARLGRGEVRLGDADALARVTSDVDDLQDAVLRGVLPYLSALVVAVGASAVAIAVLPSAGLALAVLLLAAVLLVPAAGGRRAAERERAAVAARADRDRRIGDILDGVDDLVVAGGWEPALRDLAGADLAERGQRDRRASAAGWAVAVAVLTTGIAGVLAAAWGTVAVDARALDPVLLAVLVLLPLALTDLVAEAGECGGAIGRTAAAGTRVLELLDATGPDPQEESLADEKPAVAPTIRLHRVSARWPGADRDAISDLNLELRPGSRVAVVGPSGSGKSTLVAVLLGLLPVRSGTITVDGRDVTGDQQTLRDMMSWLPAEPHLFDSTIDRNVRLGRPDADRDQLHKARDAAGLGDWIDRLPDGDRTRVGPRALAVSGGERQRIALARALLADRPVLLADEPAAHLDGATADAVTAAVLAADPSRAVLLVTHREQDLPAVDSVLRLSGGR
ncbi:thiol reductant ABC exporter subunit CydC, partial [Nakamurella lactea]|uniref:thiol reductant ABC exporter subunit CydC n=1 Tax=Nakamurella lactea TaxID=459515 RepID=UPI0003FF6B16